jgi:hypothetical protein
MIELAANRVQRRFGVDWIIEVDGSGDRPATGLSS